MSRTSPGLSCLSWLLLASTVGLADEPPQPIEPEAVSLDRPVDYATDVAPILEASCIACHNVAIDEGDLSLEEIDAMLKGGGRGPALVPGKPDESLLLVAAAHRREPVMPPPDNDAEAKPLSPHELGLIRQWILEGARSPDSPAAATIAWRPLPSHLKSIRSVALSPEARFAAAARANQVELYDLALGVPALRLIDPNLSALSGANGLIYPAGAADRDLVQSVAFSPDGSLVAAGGYRAVKLWRRTGLGETTPLDVAGATALAASPDGTTAAVAVGNEVRLIALADGAVTKTFPLSAAATFLAFAFEGKTLAAACNDKSLHAWTVADGTALPPRSLPASTRALAFAGDRLVTAHDDGILRVWPPTGEQPERELTGHAGPIRAVLPVPGQPNAIVSAGDDGTIRVWDASTGNQIRSIPHGGPVTGVAVTPDGKSLVSCGADGAVRFWTLADGKQVAEHIGLIPRRRTERRTAELLEWRRQLAAVADARLKEADAAVKEREEILKKATEAKTAADTALAEATKAEATKAEEAAATAAKAAAEQAAAKPDDEVLRKQSEEAAKKSDEAKQKTTAATEALRSAERSVSLADDALKATQTSLASRQARKQADDEHVKAAEAAATSAKAEAEPPVAATAIAVSLDGARVATTHADGAVQTFTAAGRPLDAMTFPGGSPQSVAFITDAILLALAQDGTVYRADVSGRWEYAGTLGPPHDVPLDLSRSPLVDRVLSLAFSPDGLRLATGGGEPSRSGELILWDLDTRLPIRTFADPHSDTVQSVAFSRDGAILATAAADKFAKTFDVESGTPLKSLEGHTDHVLGVALKADGTDLATASADLLIKVWNVESGEQKRTITGHAKQVTSVRYLGLSEELLSAGGDKTVRLHRTSDGRQLRTFDGPADYVHSVASSDDGSTVAAGGEDGALYVWDAASAKLLHKLEPPVAPPTTAAK